ncbi:MAG: cytochrome c1 [Pseudomonadota bacterium]
MKAPWKAMGLLLLSVVTIPAWATEIRLEKIRVSADLSALERGAETVVTMCLGCHGLKYMKYRDLGKLGIAQDKVDALRAGQALDAPLLSQMPADVALQSFGIVPPDLSLIAKARAGGASYVYSFLLGFHVNAQGIPDNRVFPGTKMPDILGVSSADDAQRAELQGRALDAASFLAWVADPRAEERRNMGKYVIAYLVVLTVLLYLVKRRVWARLK